MGSTRAFNGAPDLDTALAAEAWRRAIKNENASADQLERAIKIKRIKSQQALTMQYRHVSMPMPPTQMSLMMARLDRPETRELAVRRSMTRTNTMPSALLAPMTPWGRQLTLTPYAPVMKVPSRGALRPVATPSIPWR